MSLPAALRERAPRTFERARRAGAFVQRHRWSLPLSVLASISLWRLASEVQAGELAGFDAAIARGVTGWRGQIDGLMLALTTLGGWISMAVLTLAVLLALIWTQRRRAAVFMLASGAGTLVLSTLLKLIFARARPEGVAYLIDPPSSFSFPSGHAMGSMGVLASVVVVLHVSGAPRGVRLASIVVAALVAFGVGLSRVYLGVHYPSDVLGGELAAAAWVSAITGWFFPGLLPGEETQEPAAVGDGGFVDRDGPS
jgi:undecaprenyl-diphosphatase